MTDNATQEAPARVRRFLRLSQAECLELLAPGGLGRIAFINGRTPMILPVNYAMEFGEIIVRTAGTTMINELEAGARVAFEIDNADLGAGKGWSVVASGAIEPITSEDRLRRYEAEEPFAAFAPGIRDRWFRIVPERMSGRRIT